MPSTVFQDRVVSATDLNRASSAILNEVSQHPVTVRRPRRDDIVLLLRERAARSFQAEDRLRVLQEVVSNLFALVVFRTGVVTTGYGWMKLFDQDDLKEFTREYLETFERASSGLAEWSAVDDVVFEWRRSAEALQNKSLGREAVRVQKPNRI